MGKQVKLTFEGKPYVLEYNRKAVELMERQGFSLDDLSRKPGTMIPMLFNGAFIMHHRHLNSAVIDRLFGDIEERGDLMNVLAEMYSEPIMALVDDGEKKGNVSWVAE